MTISCPPLPSPNPPGWADADRLFAGSPVLEMRQSWKPQPDAQFLPAHVRVASAPDGLWIYAVLEDAAIFNPETQPNAFFFSLGDAFEIFLRPEHQEAYFEFHVGPANQRLQLRFPSQEAFQNQKPGDTDSWKLTAPHFQSEVQVEDGQWKVLAFVPFAGVVEDGDFSQDWMVSFSRYDYTPGERQPVLSSTSSHAALSFHRQHEWARVRFQPENSACLEAPAAADQERVC